MKKWFLAAVILFVAACDSNPAPKPEHLLNEGDMVNILYDISVLQAIKSFSPNSLTDNNVDPQNYIYKKYKIDSTTFAQNHLYYASDLKKYGEIQQKVLEQLKRDKQQLAPKKADTTATPAVVKPNNKKIRLDSIRRARKAINRP